MSAQDLDKLKRYVNDNCTVLSDFTEWLVQISADAQLSAKLSQGERTDFITWLANLEDCDGPVYSDFDDSGGP